MRDAIPRQGRCVPKRNIRLGGRHTSLTMEDRFWDHLRRMAGTCEGGGMNALLERINSGRGSLNLSSAARLAVLADLEARLATT